MIPSIPLVDAPTMWQILAWAAALATVGGATIGLVADRVERRSTARRRRVAPVQPLAPVAAPRKAA